MHHFSTQMIQRPIDSRMTHHPEILLSDARLKSPAAARQLKYNDLPKLQGERKRFDEFLAVDMAHTAMLVEQEIITLEAGRAILQQLLTIGEMGSDDFPIDVHKGSFLLQVESYLFAAIGEDIGGQMHTGRSRIDQGATVRRLYQRNRILDVLSRLNTLQVVIAEQAEKHSRTIMPGYTHMQQAQPWVFGHYLLSFSSRLHDSFERLTQAYARTNRNPLGTVGLAGTSWPLNRERTTRFLGFDGLVENSKLGREAFYAVDALSALSFVMADLNDLATDLHVWSTSEFGLVECDDSYCGTSSIFPQKKNPTALEYVRRVAGASVTWVSTALATFRGEGTGDQAMREAPILDEALATTEGMLDLFTGVVETLIVHEDRMAAALKESWCTASNLADVIVRDCGMSFRQVHHIVARVVRNSLTESVSPHELTGAMVDKAAMETVGRPVGLPDSSVQAALSPREFVDSRVTAGSVGPLEVQRLLAHAREEHAGDVRWLEEARKRLIEARGELDRAVDRIVEPTRLEINGFK
ncbi:argininosuccinate lyase [Variovorax sp. J22R133]|uniref:argininosuccinate lyase n=1 Tax=Variovorax brevis TaxID=3053503 RepID=UPI002576060E|nr:argininosuccinate lyase [Variovorax sp. J22R133]MDM0110907.1 argininosuccinate lyase [Variovorax sp. J22R133]